MYFLPNLFTSCLLLLKYLCTISAGRFFRGISRLAVWLGLVLSLIISKHLRTHALRDGSAGMAFSWFPKFAWNSSRVQGYRFQGLKVRV